MWHRPGPSLLPGMPMLPGLSTQESWCFVENVGVVCGEGGGEL